jgi:hypothetical protein
MLHRVCPHVQLMLASYKQTLQQNFHSYLVCCKLMLIPPSAARSRRPPSACAPASRQQLLIDKKRTPTVVGPIFKRKDVYGALLTLQFVGDDGFSAQVEHD